MHGGAPGSGAPEGRRNGRYRHGLYTNEAVALRRVAMNLIRQARKMLADLQGDDRGDSGG